MRTLVLVTIAGLALASAAAAGEEDPQARFVAAYAAEVIEGKVAEAAGVYLALFSDEAAPAALRAEARFRFAVCAVLLGRADEARAHLADLVRDPATPAALRDRAAEYARSVENLGVGSELSRKLESLVYDLGRVPVVTPPTERDPPSVYRDFEIIGPAAVPFLRRLLAHPDLSLRRHAFRLLLRMDADGLVEAWTPDIGLWDDVSRDLAGWTEKRPEAATALLSRFLATPDDVLASIVSALPRTGWGLPEDFLRAAAARLGVQVAGIVHRVKPPERYAALLADWVAGADAELATAAAERLLASGAPVPAEVFAAALRRFCAALPPDLGRPDQDSRLLGLRKMADALPPTEALDRLADLLAPGADQPPRNPLALGVADALALSLDGRLADPAVALRYRDLLLRWSSVGWFEAARLAKHVEAALAALPPDGAEAFAVSLVAAPRLKGNRGIETVLAPAGARGLFAPLLAALRAAKPDDREQVLLAFGFPNHRGLPADAARRLLAVVPEILAVEDQRVHGFVFSRLPNLFTSLPEPEVAEFLAALPGPILVQDLGYLLHPVYRRSVLAALDPLAGLLLPSCGPALVKWALDLLGAIDGGDAAYSTAERDRLWRFVLDHAEHITQGGLPRLAGVPEAFPIEEWFPRLPEGLVRRHDNSWMTRIATPEKRDAAARALTADPDRSTEDTLCFAAIAATEETRREIAARLLGTAAGPALARVHSYFGDVVAPEAVEAALARELARPAPDLLAVFSMTFDLLQRRPSEALFPAVRLLLASGDAKRAMNGIECAKRLGRPDLLPDLGRLLDSLSSDMRDAAREAMDAILELERLREEAKSRSEPGTPQSR